MVNSLAEVSDLQWAEMAQSTGLSGPALKREISLYLRDDSLTSQPLMPPELGAFASDGACQTTPFAAPLWGDIAVIGRLTICGPTDQWSGSIRGTISLANQPMVAINHSFGYQNSHAIGRISLPILRASYVMGISTDRWCFSVKGTFANLTAKSWKEAAINRTIFCFGEL